MSTTIDSTANFQRHADLPPPITSVGALGWLRQNLLSSPFNTALTLLALYLLYLLLPPVIGWAFLQADWIGTTRADCASGGACWVFIQVRLNQFLYGFYPEAELWRIQLAAGLLVLAAAPLFVKRFPWKRWLVAFLVLVYPVVAFYLFVGDRFGLAHVPTDKWGGLTLTLVLSLVAMVFSLPLGILLALGRRSTTMPLVKALCVSFIECWRGVPQITMLFMASVMLPLFMPEGANVDKLLRALIGLSLFWSAYMAEAVRGGLQGVAKGQYEAADALGLSYPKAMALVILPQAMKLAIPAIVNTFIALFKNTSLVLIIGLFDLLGSIDAAKRDADWLGYVTEGYVFAAFLYWIFCFGMSRYSQRLEEKLHTGHKRK
jgi:general L-amino acid transport system permease protein